MSYNGDVLKGATRDLVLARLGLEDTGQVVVLTEDSGWSGGCETCSYWFDDIYIDVDGERMWRDGDIGIAGLVNWLNEAPEESP